MNMAFLKKKETKNWFGFKGCLKSWSKVFKNGGIGYRMMVYPLFICVCKGMVGWEGVYIESLQI